MQGRYSLLIADDHKILREGLKKLIEDQSDMEVVGEANNGREAISIINKTNPNVVIMDVSMPDMNGMEATKQIVKDFPHIKVVALSMHIEKQFVEGMFAAGALAYILKDCASEELVKAIRTVVKNKIYISADISDVVMEGYIESLSRDKKETSGNLTSREREVLQLIVEGKKTKETAKILHTSVKTVETHRYNIMTKLNINNIACLTKYAIREGITSI